MSVKGLRLVTGEVILSEFVSVDENSYVLKNPAQLVTQEIEPGRMGVALQPFVPYSKGNITVLKYSVNVEFELEQQVENEYNRLFGSGIVIAAANELPIQK